jgi:hypothetical protein
VRFAVVFTPALVQVFAGRGPHGDFIVSSRRLAKGRISGPFVPLLKATMKTEPWKMLSHGARSLYAILKWRYNSITQNAVFASTRDAEKELGQHSTRPNVMRWFRELEHYGFIRMVSPAHHGVNGHGKAPHWRLTEEGYLGKEPTRDFLRWDGTPFTEKRKRKAPLFTAKNRVRGDHGVTTLVTTGTPLVPEIVSADAASGDHGDSISPPMTGDHGVAITNKPLAKPSELNLLTAYEAVWIAPNAVPLKGLGLRRLFLPPAKRPDDLAVAKYFARWYAEPKKLAA